MKLLLFVSSHCPHCPGAERVVKNVVSEYEDYGVTFSKIRTKAPDGKELSLKYNVMSTPSILLFDENGTEIKRIVGVPGASDLKNHIEKALGLKKSFFGRIFGLVGRRY